MLTHTDIYINLIIKVLLLISVIITAINIYYKDDFLLKLVKNRTIVDNFYIIMGCLAVYLLFNRNTYLPFLGESAVPSNLFCETTSKINLEDPTKNIISFTIYAPNADKVIWWASNPNEKSNEKNLPTPKEAYGEYENSGVSNVQDDGYAYVTFQCPQKYKVLFGKLPKHIHYRETHGGMLSEVKTINVSC
jgi:hypothetical protein